MSIGLPFAYPEPSLQRLFEDQGPGPWWLRDIRPKLCRGRLAHAYIPYAESVTHRLEKLEDPNSYRVAGISQKHDTATRPIHVVGLPRNRGNSDWGLLPCKRRPVLVLGLGGVPVSKEIKIGRSKWRFSETCTVAPFFSVSGGSTAPLPETFVEGVRLCAYPQYIWDQCPNDRGQDDEGSVLYLNQLQPMGAASLQLTPYRLHDAALTLVDEWISWSLTGELLSWDTENLNLSFYREYLLEGISLEIYQDL